MSELDKRKLEEQKDGIGKEYQSIRESDTSHADSKNLIKIPEDYVFLQDQLKSQKMIMFGKDKMFAQCEQKNSEMYV